ncbi:hypothetical protein HOU08_gp185 [Dickeya phage vB_DsoM_JA29]|uniref:Uncharacterized protein n=1 Tax=Dickeya phage vB_DsoM_JA29 TaxID=2283031 RepID=A0A384ZXE7_9CAUD|nr:hypothetical protein HOU08_gp185 [Dickeya phage vB_DsoM_JA29]AXG66911.1 hypothetical protein JA29_185 [Dickeya phage vB_DsoM_JA29]
MTLETEYFIWMAVIVSVIGCELTDFRTTPKISTALVTSFLLTLCYVPAYTTETQQMTFYFVSVLLNILLFYMYAYLCDDMPSHYKKFYVLDIGLFQGATALAIYKFV